MFAEKYPVNPNAQDYTFESDGDCGVLFVHGFTGSPYFFREYAKQLHGEGIYVRALRLPGHGTHVKDLERSSHHDWRETVRDELDALLKKKKHVFLLGYSFGANLTIDVASEYGEKLSGIILISPAIFLHWDKLLRLLARFYDRYTNARIRPKPGVNRRYKKFYTQLKEYEQTGAYLHIPVKSAIEFFYYVDTFTKPRLADVSVPCLILQSDHDPVTRARSATYVYDRLGSKDKHLVMISNNEHVIISDDIRKKVYKEVVGFVKNH